MRILIDECLPAGLRAILAGAGHECETARRAGFGSKKNGELLSLATGRWDVLLTSDRRMKYQQNMTGRSRRGCGPVRQVQSPAGFVAADARLSPSAPFDLAWTNRRSRAAISNRATETRPSVQRMIAAATR